MKNRVIPAPELSPTYRVPILPEEHKLLPPFVHSYWRHVFLSHKVVITFGAAYSTQAAGYPMPTGRVKWFNNAKGYGFILPDGGGEDYFAHYSSIQMDGYKTLKAGQLVEFDILEGPKGSHAVNIHPIETPDQQQEAE